MKKTTWAGLKFLGPLTILIYALNLLLNFIEQIWFKALFSYFEIFRAPAAHQWLLPFSSIIATLIILLFCGRLVETNLFKRVFGYVAAKIPLLNLIWSEKEEDVATPVLFQHPIEGEWKIGYIFGTQKLDDGREFYRIFFFTGIGDHELIEKKRTDLFIKLANPPQEIAKLITSLMIHGPAELQVLKNTNIKTEKTAK